MLALVLIAVLVVLFSYWFFLNPHDYWQKQKETEINEYMEKQIFWRKSEKMTMQQMLPDMTLMAKGDSVLVCWVTGLSLPVIVTSFMALHNQQGVLGRRRDIGKCLLSLKAENGWRSVPRRGFARA